MHDEHQSCLLHHVQYENIYTTVMTTYSSLYIYDRNKTVDDFLVDQTLGHTNKITCFSGPPASFFPPRMAFCLWGLFYIFLVKVVRTNLPQNIAYYVIAYFTSRDAPVSHVRMHAFNIELHPRPCSFFFLSVSTKIVSRLDLSTKLLRDWRIVNSF